MYKNLLNANKVTVIFATVMIFAGIVCDYFLLTTINIKMVNPSFYLLLVVNIISGFIILLSLFNTLLKKFLLITVTPIYIVSLFVSLVVLKVIFPSTIG
jgi:hypothetical protein